MNVIKCVVVTNIVWAYLCEDSQTLNKGENSQTLKAKN